MKQSYNASRLTPLVRSNLCSLVHDVAIAVIWGSHLIVRLLKGVLRKEPSALVYFAQKWGLYIRRVPQYQKPVLWFHGVSVGEVLAADKLIGALRHSTREDVAIVLSTMTADGLQAVQRLVNKPDASFIYPLDLSPLANRVVNWLRPRALVLVDGDFWLQMLRRCRKHGTSGMVINGCISSRSVRRYRRFGAYSRELFAPVNFISAQSEEMMARFSQLPIPKSRIAVDGNIKLSVSIPPINECRRAELNRKLGIVPHGQCLVFGSIHPADLKTLGPVIQRLAATRNEVQIVIAPRHPEQFTRTVVTKLFPTVPLLWYAPHEVAILSEAAQLIWVNQVGLLRDLYQLAKVTCVGGTFGDVGGHNLLEPAHFGAPVVYGPDISGQRPLHELLQRFRLGWQVKSEDELLATTMMLLDNPELRVQVRHRVALLRMTTQHMTTRMARHIVALAGLSLTPDCHVSEP
jgi:3-deoxy-D-manno-octulosonic-acid transferase